MNNELDQRRLFSALCQAVGGEPDRKGEVWITCPNCGKEGDHCSFNSQAWHCFACGEGGGIRALQRRLGAEPFVPFRYTPRSKPSPRRYNWQEEADELLGRYENHPDRTSKWNVYRPFSRNAVARFHLGLGVLPACRCVHERLVYPAFDAKGKIIAFRGRAIRCDCAKWLQSAGSRVTLWGGALLTRGQEVIVCESPVDAMMCIEAEPSVVAIASTGGASTWRPSWTKWIADHEPERVVVWFDNDLAGFPNKETRKELGVQWMEKHPKARQLPRANGPFVAQKLISSGIKSILYHWPAGTPPGYDLSALLMEEM